MDLSNQKKEIARLTKLAKKYSTPDRADDILQEAFLRAIIAGEDFINGGGRRLKNVARELYRSEQVRLRQEQRYGADPDGLPSWQLNLRYATEIKKAKQREKRARSKPCVCCRVQFSAKKWQRPHEFEKQESCSKLCAAKMRYQRKQALMK